MSIRFIVLFLFLIPGLIIGLFNRFAALLVYLWVAMFRPVEWVFTDVTWLRPSLLSALVLLVPALLTGIFPTVTHPISFGFLAFLLSGLIAQVDAVRPDVGWHWLDYMGRLMLVCLVAVTILNTRRRLLIAIWVFAGGLLIHAVKAALVMLAEGSFRLEIGISGMFGDNNEYALGVVMVLPFLIAVARNFDTIGANWPRAIRWGLWLCVPLCVMTVIATYSRGGAVSMFVAAAVYMALERRRLIAIWFVVFLAGVGVWFAGTLPGYSERLETVSTDTTEASATGRMHFWRVAIDVAEEWPLGIGLRNFEHIYDRYDTSAGAYGRGRAVHNSHLQVLAEVGIFGLVSWVSLFLYSMFAAFRLRRKYKDPSKTPEDRRFWLTLGSAFITSMVGFLVGGTFLSMAYNDATWFIFAFVAAADRLRRREAAVPARVAAPITVAPAVPRIARTAVR